MAHVYMRIGHLGKPSPHDNDRGAWSPVADAWESDLTIHAAAAAVPVLQDAGHEVTVWPVLAAPTYYGQDHARVVRESEDARRSVYVQWHADVGERVSWVGPYHDHRSTWGRDCSQKIAEAWRQEWAAELGGHFTAIVKAATPEDWTAHAYNTISGVYSSRHAFGLCLEVARMDNPAHAPLLTPDGLRRIGTSTAEGLVAYLGRSANLSTPAA